jgi:hypothetical protein
MCRVNVYTKINSVILVTRVIHHVLRVTCTLLTDIVLSVNGTLVIIYVTTPCVHCSYIGNAYMSLYAIMHTYIPFLYVKDCK